MRCKACRVKHEGGRFQIDKDGTVSLIGMQGELLKVTDPDVAKAVRATAARLRRNRNARERHEALTSLGLVRVRGNLGGTYYE